MNFDIIKELKKSRLQKSFIKYYYYILNHTHGEKEGEGEEEVGKEKLKILMV